MMDQVEAFHILASADRQLILHELLEKEQEASIEELSLQVAARRHRIPPEKISDAKVRCAHVRLVHTHLPVLQDNDIINVNWDNSEVSLLNGGDVDQLFDAAKELESWPPKDLLEHPSRNN